LIEIGNCIFPNEEKLLFIYGKREYEVLKIDKDNDKFLLKGFENFMPINIFFNVDNFYKFSIKIYPEHYI
jgi:hypothetical protein